MIYQFDATQVKPQVPQETIPPGQYLCKVASIDYVPTQKKDGHFFEIKHTITEGEYINREITDRINIDLPKSPKTEEIARSQWSALCRVTGVFKMQDTNDVIGKALQVKVGFQKEKKAGSLSADNLPPGVDAPTTKKGNDEQYTEVKGYLTIEGLTADKVAISSTNLTTPGSAPTAPVGQVMPPSAPLPPTAPAAVAAPPPPPAAPTAPVADPTAGWHRQNGYRFNPGSQAWEPDTPPAAPAPPPPPAAPQPPPPPPAATAAPQAPPPPPPAAPGTAAWGTPGGAPPPPPPPGGPAAPGWAAPPA